MDDSGIPAGFRLRHTLSGHSSRIIRIAWSPDGTKIASASNDCTVRIWDPRTGKCLHLLRGHSQGVGTVAWSPNGTLLASGSRDQKILIWDTAKGIPIHRIEGHHGLVRSVAWHPNGRFLASGSNDNSVSVWDSETGLSYRVRSDGQFLAVAWTPEGQLLAACSGSSSIIIFSINDQCQLELAKTLRGHSPHILDLALSPMNNVLASASGDSTIGIWDGNFRQVLTLEGHTHGVTGASFSSDGSLLATKSLDNSVRLWRTDVWQQVALIPEPASPETRLWQSGLAFHPEEKNSLATLGLWDGAIRIWDLDLEIILSDLPPAPVTYYTNAKVVLVGDSGVGKSGLGLVLSGAPFEPTPSTHGRRVWTLSSTETELEPGCIEKRETLLWDLAGQPGYRLIHQLHLKEVMVALIVFDARSDTDPFSGIQHWVRALRNAQAGSGGTHPVKKFLVAARTDRGGIAASQSRIDFTLQDLDIDKYFATSAKEGWGLAELSEAIRNSIAWDDLPKVRSNDLFQEIKAFLIEEKQEDRLLCTSEDLYRGFRRSRPQPGDPEDLRPEFDLCIRLVEQRDLIRRLSFGGFVLLQPELLDAYASAIVNAAKTEPDGLGSISEEAAKAGHFAISKDERLEDREQEKLLLIATIEDLLRHEIALREHADDGPYLVFPSQLTRENKDLPDPEGKTISFRFEGAVLNIYATLAVRLSHSGVFEKGEMWKNAATYKSRTGGACGIVLKEDGEGSGELMLFFDQATSEETRFHFEEYITAHLARRALPESIVRRRFYSCSTCGTSIADMAVQRLRKQNRFRIECYVCGNSVSLLDREERLAVVSLSLVGSMDKAADERRDTETAALIIQGKRETGNFDIFLCHNSEDKGEVKKIGEILQQHGILPWLDEWELRPGLPWQTLLERQIGNIHAVAVFVGGTGIGPWQDMELRAFLSQFVKRNCPVIPVILENVKNTPELPLFLQSMTWVDFRQADPDPLERLIWGITGERRSSIP